MNSNAKGASQRGVESAIAIQIQENLQLDPKSRVQTGPAEPEWEMESSVLFVGWPCRRRGDDQADLHVLGSAPNPDRVSSALIIALVGESC